MLRHHLFINCFGVNLIRLHLGADLLHRINDFGAATIVDRQAQAAARVIGRQFETFIHLFLHVGRNSVATADNF